MKVYAIIDRKDNSGKYELIRQENFLAIFYRENQCLMILDMLEQEIIEFYDENINSNCFFYQFCVPELNINEFYNTPLWNSNVFDMKLDCENEWGVSFKHRRSPWTVL